MFDSITKVRRYEKALELLANPRIKNWQVVLHDYNEPCYRTGPEYTFNGLHWGYPDDIVDSITRTPCTHSWSTAYFKCKTAQSRIAEDLKNSRYSVVKYGEIQEIVEKGVRQKLEIAKAEAKEEESDLAEWKAIVEKEYAAFKKAAIRLQAFHPENNSSFELIVIQPERFTTRGFGSFLENIKRGDVSMNAAMQDRLMRIQDRKGLYAFEGWSAGSGTKGANPIIGGMFGLRSTIPLAQANAQKGFAQKIISLATIE